MICARCGQENPDGFRFCGHCGADLGAAVRELRKTVTVVFCDLTGSTQLGERLDPEAVRSTMRRYFDELRTILERHGGTVEKFIGDAVMAVFGVPASHEDDALRAVRAAFEMRHAVAGLGLEARIGVNTGEVVAGEGDSLVTGDAVNVAARLEQSAEAGEVLIGAETRRLVRDAVRVEEVELAVKGKTATVEAYRLVDVDLHAPAVARRLDSPLVGRRRELARLHDDFESVAAQRSCHLFTLLGAPGVGKSRLVAEFLGRIDARPVRGRCLPYGEGITYWPVVEVVMQLEADPDPLLALSSPVEIAVSARKLFERHAAEKPLVAVFDDIQWAEPAFLDLVEHVADWSRDAPILLLCIARPELLELRPMWGGGKLNVTTLLLEPLDADETETLIANLLGAAEVEEDTRRRVVQASEGNPLFVEEMLAMMQEDGSADVAVPPTIHALLQARLDTLAEDERAVIERGAVEGEVFHRSPVADLSPPPIRRDLDASLSKLVRKELIRPDRPTIPGDDAFRFRHLLIRDAAYEALPKQTRAELHERFAIWLEEHVELIELDEICGYHFEQAVLYRRELGRDDVALGARAAERLGAAGRAALGRRDNSAGAGLLGRGAGLLPPAHELRLRLLPDLVVALLELGRFDAAGSHLEELEDSSEERWHAYALVLRPIHKALTGTGSLAEGGSAVARAKATFERLGDDSGLARAFLMEGNFEWLSCRAEAAAAAFRRGLTYAQRAGNQALVDELWENLVSTNAHGPRPVEEAEREIEAILEESRGLVVEATAQRALGRLAAMRGDFETGRRLARAGREVLADAGFAVMHAATSQAEGMVEDLAGNIDAAVTLLREGFETLADLDEHAFASTNAVFIAGLLCRAGNDDDAANWLARARELSPANDVSTLATADAVEAILLARRGAHEQAQRLARQALSEAETTDFWAQRGRSREALAQVLEAAGRRDEARAALEDAVGVYEEKGVVVEAKRVRALLAEL